MNNRGQSLIEAAFFFLVLAPLIGMVLGFTHYFQIREKLVMAAWDGAVLYSSGCVSPAEAHAQVRTFLITGSPALDPAAITISRQRLTTMEGIYYQLERVTVRYQSPKRWHTLLNLPLTLEETCTIKHAPHYWDPLIEHLKIPNAPPVHGPAYPW